MINRYIEIGDNIRNLREKMKLSQEKLAEKAGLSLSSYKRIENGEEATYKFKNVESIANALGIQVYDIVPEFSEFKTLLESIYQKGEEREVREELRAQKLFYPNVDNPYNYPIRTLLEFLNYLPLFDWNQLVDILVNRFNGTFSEYEDYICDQLRHLYNDIEDKEAKRYADHKKEELTYGRFISRYDEVKYKDWKEKEKLYLDSEEYKIGEKMYFKRLDYIFKLSETCERLTNLIKIDYRKDNNYIK